MPIVNREPEDTGSHERLRVGVIGYGYWGPNLVRNFVEVSGSTVTAVADRSSQRREAARQRYPWIRALEDASELIADPCIDAVVVATPVSTHFELALQALRASKHVLVEKPITTTSEQALELIREARERKLVLMVDHTFVYTGAVRKIYELISTGQLGQIYYYDSVRVNLGLFQSDVNVMWDLAVHDLSIIDRVMPHKPLAVAAHAVSHVPGHPENVGYVTLYFPDSQIAHLHVNWLAPVKVRTTLIGGRDRMILYDDVQPSEKVKVYDKGAMSEASDRYSLLVKYRFGDMWAPQLDNSEALQVEVAHFVDCVQNGTLPITDGWAGLRVVKILEAADQSVREGGRALDLEWPKTEFGA
jgi:predicted dehydrogenase